MATPSSAQEGLVGVEDVEEFDLGSLLEAPIVDAASKRSQSLHESPASITVIDAETISRMGTSQTAEVLARAVGVDLMQTNSTAFNVGMRGLNPLLNNRVLVQIDGRGVDEPSLGAIQWGALPLHVGDIEKIEVVRGPGSTLYGANAFSGVVAIRTKRPLDHPGIEADVTASVQASPESPLDPALRYQARSGGQGYAAYGWTNDEGDVGLRASMTFNKRPEWQNFGNTAQSFHFDYQPYHEDLALGARIALDILPDNDTTVEIDVTHAMAETGIAMPAAIAGTSLATEEQAIRLSAQRRSLFDDILDLSLLLDARSVALFSAQADVDAEAIIGHGLLQADLRLFEGKNVTTVAAEASYSKAENLFYTNPSRIYFAGVVQNETRFLEDENLLLNLGVRLEQATSKGQEDVEVIYRNINPRGSLVWWFADDHDVRISYASAYRTPSFLEALTGSRNAGLYPDEIPLVQGIAANSALEPERVQSLELGYRSKPLPTLRGEAVVFGQLVNDLVGLRRTRALPLLFDNLEDWRQLGAELALDFAPNDALSGYVQYTLVHTEDAHTGATITDAPPHIFGFGIDMSFEDDITLHSDANISVGAEPVVYETRADDIAAFKRSIPPKTVLNMKVAKAIFDDRAEVYLSGRNLLAFFMENESLVQYPQGVHRIGATVMLGVSIKTVEALP